MTQSLWLQAQVVSDTINVTAGNLGTQLGNQKDLITDLTLTGEINGNDIGTIRSMASLTVINMADVNIVAGGSFYVPNNGYLSVTSNQIPDRMFLYMNKLTSVILPNSVTSIGVLSFGLCSGLTSVSIPNNVTSIGNSAFQSCSGLTSATISASVNAIGDWAFYYCTNITNFIVSDDNATFTDLDGVVFNKNMTQLVLCPNAKSGSYTIPSGVLSIRDGAFSICSRLTSVTIPNSVTSIGNSAFLSCGLTSLTIPNSVTYIGNSAFRSCTGLTSVVISNSITSINDFTFYGCVGLTSVNIPNGVTYIGNSAFRECRLTSVVIPNSVTYIAYSAFCSCTELTDITISSNATYIGAWAFQDCVKITSIIIPGSVTSIGNGALYNCTGLTKIYSKNVTPPSTVSATFTNINKATCILYVPAGSYAAYRGATGWSEFTNIIEEITYYSIYTSSNTGGTIVPSSISVKKGDPVTFTITPNQGYKIASATLNGNNITSGIINNIYSVQAVNEDLTLAVTFAVIPQYEMSATYNIGGKVFINDSILVSGNNISVPENTSVTFRIAPDADYAIDKVLLNNQDITAQLQNSSYTVNVVSAVQAINVTFVRTHYNLTVNANIGGNVSLNGQIISSTVKVEANKPLMLTFTLNQGYIITAATINGNDITSGIINNTYTISVVNENIILNVNFMAVTQYKITTTYNNGGKIYINEILVANGSTFLVIEYSSPTIRIEPNDNFAIKKVWLNNPNILPHLENNSYRIDSISSDQSLEVTFIRTHYNLTVNANSGGGVYEDNQVVNSTIKVEANKKLRLTFTPNQGYVIASATLNGTDITSEIKNNVYKGEAVNEDITLNVVFEKTISFLKESNIKVYAEENSIVIMGVNLGERISVYNILGNLLQTIIVTNYEVKINVPVNQIYLIKTSSKTFKVTLLN